MPLINIDWEKLTKISPYVLSTDRPNIKGIAMEINDTNKIFLEGKTLILPKDLLSNLPDYNTLRLIKFNKNKSFTYEFAGNKILSYGGIEYKRSIIAEIIDKKLNQDILNIIKENNTSDTIIFSFFIDPDSALEQIPNEVEVVCDFYKEVVKLLPKINGDMFLNKLVEIDSIDEINILIETFGSNVKVNDTYLSNSCITQLLDLFPNDTLPKINSPFGDKLSFLKNILKEFPINLNKNLLPLDLTYKDVNPQLRNALKKWKDNVIELKKIININKDDRGGFNKVDTWVEEVSDLIKKGYADRIDNKNVIILDWDILLEKPEIVNNINKKYSLIFTSEDFSNMRKHPKLSMLSDRISDNKNTYGDYVFNTYKNKMNAFIRNNLLQLACYNLHYKPHIISNNVAIRKEFDDIKLNDINIMSCDEFLSSNLYKNPLDKQPVVKSKKKNNKKNNKKKKRKK